jgi:hypothetical protein
VAAFSGRSQKAGPHGSAFFFSSGRYADTFGGPRSIPQESPIAQANPATFAKRALEQQKKRKAEDKLARRTAKKLSKAGGTRAF